MYFDLLLDVDELLHHVLINMQTAGCIYDDHVMAVLFGIGHSFFSNINRLMIGPH